MGWRLALAIDNKIEHTNRERERHGDGCTHTQTHTHRRAYISHNQRMIENEITNENEIEGWWGSTAINDRREYGS